MSGEVDGRWMESACVCFAPSTELVRFSACLVVCLFVVVCLSCPSEFTCLGDHCVSLLVRSVLTVSNFRYFV